MVYYELQILVRSQKQISFVKIETGLLCEIGCGDGARVICFFARAVRHGRSVDAENSSRRRLLLCLRRGGMRRVHFARPRTRASEPAVTSSSLAEKRRADALHVSFFNNQKLPSPARWLTAAAVYSRMVRKPRMTRAGCAARQLDVVWLRRGAASVFAHRGCIPN